MDQKTQAYISRRVAEGRLVIGYVDGGLTSVLQICDLCANKQLKALIKKLYLKWRAEFIKAERERHPDEPHRRVKLKISIEKMTEIIEAAIKEFNLSEKKNQSIKKTFKAAGQDIWSDWEEVEPLFEEHLNKLAKLPLYKHTIENQTSTELRDAGSSVEDN